MLRAQVLDTARGLVGAEGLGALTVARLSAEAGVANGSLYHHFGSRGGIVAELCLEAFTACLRPISAELDDRPAVVAVPAMAEAYVRWCVADRGRATLLYEGIGQVDDPQRLVATKAAAFGHVVGWMAGRAAVGEVRPVEAWELDPIVLAPAHECVRRHLLSGGRWDAVTVTPQIGRAVWGILRPARSSDTREAGGDDRGRRDARPVRVDVTHPGARARRHHGGERRRRTEE